MKEKCVFWETWKLHRPPQGKEGLLLKDIRIFLLGEADPTWQMGWFGWGTPWKNPGEEINLTGGLYMLCGLGNLLGPSLSPAYLTPAPLPFPLPPCR